MSDMATKLYTPQILALTIDLAEYPLAGRFQHSSEARAQVCGSRMTIGLSLDDGGRITHTGARVTACAIGQAAAALFLKGAAGLTRAQIADAQSALAAWLSGEGQLPQWPDMEAARAFPGRHDAIALPWKAALAALPNHPVSD